MKINLNQITKFIIVLSVVLGLANLVVTNVLATGGHELNDVNSQTIVLQKNNLYLKNQIAQASSLANIEGQAIALGFTPIRQTVAISGSTPVAYMAQ